jgi:hypothetical protein
VAKKTIAPNASNPPKLCFGATGARRSRRFTVQTTAPPDFSTPLFHGH